MPSDDSIRARWDRRPHSCSFEQAKQIALEFALARAEAAAGERPVVPAPLPAAPTAAAPPGHYGSLRIPHGPTFDRKRAAAGERDDD